MNRTTARETALQVVFELCFSGYADPDAIEFRLSEDGLALLAEEGGLFTMPLEDEYREYIMSTVRGVLEHLQQLDEYISRFSEGWKIERVSRMAKAVLRIALYEMEYAELPAEIAINEAVELTKKYDAETSAPAFINGILGSYVRRNDDDKA